MVVVVVVSDVSFCTGGDGGRMVGAGFRFCTGGDGGRMVGAGFRGHCLAFLHRGGGMRGGGRERVRKEGE